jgi:drug/metabolite transporter (DMT)-like permease
MIAGGLALLAVSAGLGEWGRVHPDTFGPTFWLAGGHLVLLGSLVGFWAYTWLVARVDQRLASTYAYVNPAIAVLLGWLLLGEHLTRGALAGTALVTGAVAWTVLSQSRTGAAQPAELRTTSVGTTPLRSTPVRSTPVRSTRPERTKATT